MLFDEYTDAVQTWTISKFIDAVKISIFYIDFMALFTLFPNYNLSFSLHFLHVIYLSFSILSFYKQIPTTFFLFEKFFSYWIWWFPCCLMEKSSKNNANFQYQILSLRCWQPFPPQNRNENPIKKPLTDELNWRCLQYYIYLAQKVSDFHTKISIIDF